MGTSVDAITVTLTTVSQQAVSENAVDIGNSFTYQLVIDLPAIDAAYSTDFSIEFFAFSPLTGKFYCRQTHFRFCLKTVIYLFHLG
jgi:hypothetical protein